jgi:hypothetical protein
LTRITEQRNLAPRRQDAKDIFLILFCAFAPLREKKISENPCHPCHPRAIALRPLREIKKICNLFIIPGDCPE